MDAADEHDGAPAAVPDAAAPDEVVPDAVVPGTSRPSRSARRIVAAVAVAVVVLAGLAAWVLLVPYEVDGRIPGERIECGREPSGQVDYVDETAFRRTEQRIERACDDARDDRRTTALLVGAAVATAAAAISTVPSRRLTGEKLGPLR